MESTSEATKRMQLPSTESCFIRSKALEKWDSVTKTMEVCNPLLLFSSAFFLEEKKVRLREIGLQKRPTRRVIAMKL